MKSIADLILDLQHATGHDRQLDISIGLVMGHQVAEGYRLISIDIDDEEMVEKIKSSIGHYTVAKKGKKGLTIFMRAAMSFSVPRMFVETSSVGLYDVASTRLSAAAWTTMSHW